MCVDVEASPRPPDMVAETAVRAQGLFAHAGLQVDKEYLLWGLTTYA